MLYWSIPGTAPPPEPQAHPRSRDVAPRRLAEPPSQVPPRNVTVNQGSSVSQSWDQARGCVPEGLDETYFRRRPGVLRLFAGAGSNAASNLRATSVSSMPIASQTFFSSSRSNRRAPASYLLTNDCGQPSALAISVW